MHYGTVGKLGLSVFALVFLYFLVRGFGQLLVGSDLALTLAAPIALVAAGLAAVLVAFWVLSRVGITTIEE